MHARISRYALVLLLASTLFSARAPRPLAITPDPPGRLERIGRLPILHLCGSPYEMGLQQGSLLRTTLRGLVEDYLHHQVILGQGVPHARLLSYAHAADRDIPPAFQQEMQGIADASGLSYRDILLLNLVPDVLLLERALPSQLGLAPLGVSATEAGGTRQGSQVAFAAWGPATWEGELLLGYHAGSGGGHWFYQCLLITVRHSASGGASVSLGRIGSVGVWAGINEERVAVLLNASPSVDQTASGWLFPLLLRQVLERAGSLEEAQNLVLAGDRPCGGNVILADGKVPQATAVESSAHRYALFTDEGHALLARTNHFRDPELVATQLDALAEPAVDDSHERLAWLEAWLGHNRGWIGPEKALAFLAASPFAMLPSRSQEDGCGSPAPQCVVFDASNLRAWIGQKESGLAGQGHVELDLSSALRATCGPP